MLDLQGLVDGMAERVGRAVAIDNQYVEMLVTSAQLGRIDDARAAAVLNRRTPEPVVGYVRALKLEQREGPVFVEGISELQTLSRICYPLRHGSEPVGYLWLINEPPVTDRDLGIVEDTLPDIIEQLALSAQERTSVVGATSRLTDEALKSKTPEALIRAHEQGLLPDFRQLAIYRCRVHGQDGVPSTATQLRRLIEDLVASTYPGHFICTVQQGDLVAFTGSDDVPERALSFLSAVTQSARRLNMSLAGSGMARVSAEHWEAVITADRQARQALRLSLTGETHTLTQWDHCGAWKLLLDHTFTADPLLEMSEPISRLTQSDPLLAETLWVYFDSGRNVQRTCSHLHIHRATFYYRLNRIKEICGSELLEDGSNALGAHLALQYWHRLLRTSKSV